METSQTQTSGSKEARVLVFLYTGENRDKVPDEIVHALVDSSVKEIRGHAFHMCCYMVTVRLESGLLSIGPKSFFRCYSLESVVVPGTVLKIEEAAFSHCESLVTVTLMDGLQRIQKGAFKSCKALRTIIIPSTVREIGVMAFMHCLNLRSVTLSEGPLQVIGMAAFFGCISLVHVTIPSTIKVIDDNAFRNCRNLRVVDLPRGLRVIGLCVFYQCRSLKKVLIPSSVREIGGAAFAYCTNLTSVEISQGLKQVGQEAFRGCKSLVNVAIPSTVNEFGEYVFYGCNKLQDTLQNVGLDGLRNRFDKLSIHQLCYDQGCYSTSTVLEKVRNVAISSLISTDAFGMTPFHILALSAKPNCFLFRELLKLFSVDLISSKDKWGKTPLHYLCLNHHHSQESRALITEVLQLTVVDRLKWLAFAKWRIDISNKIDALMSLENDTRIQLVDEIQRKLVKYEMLETISLLEQVLWRFKMHDESGFFNTDMHHGRRPQKKAKTDNESHFIIQLDSLARQNCRINCGADVVISNVMSFLGKTS